jgi:hypothetical protein
MKLGVKYKFIISHEWTFKWMNSMALTSMTTILLQIKSDL